VPGCRRAHRQQRRHPVLHHVQGGPGGSPCASPFTLSLCSSRSALLSPKRLRCDTGSACACGGDSRPDTLFSSMSSTQRPTPALHCSMLASTVIALLVGPPCNNPGAARAGHEPLAGQRHPGRLHADGQGGAGGGHGRGDDRGEHRRGAHAGPLRDHRAGVRPPRAPRAGGRPARTSVDGRAMSHGAGLELMCMLHEECSLDIKRCRQKGSRALRQDMQLHEGSFVHANVFNVFRRNSLPL